MISRYSFRITGIERKEVAQIIAKETNQVSTYAGPPSFAYVIGNISIDRSGMINAPVDKELENIRISLSKNGVIADGAFNITMKEHTGGSLRNLVNIISSKEKLLNRALGRTGEIISGGLVEAVNVASIVGVEDFAIAIKGLECGGINFDFNNMIIKYGFYKPDLNVDTIKTYEALSILIDEQSRKLKHASSKQKEVDNDKYAMRCWLLRLGMIGDEYKTTRKILLEKLTGNSSFRTDEALQIAIANRKTE